jgi:hypothetical protein
MPAPDPHRPTRRRTAEAHRHEPALCAERIKLIDELLSEALHGDPTMRLMPFEAPRVRDGELRKRVTASPAYSVPYGRRNAPGPARAPAAAWGPCLRRPAGRGRAS